MLHAHPTRECIITCPHCATEKSEIMPDDACLFFYECSGCGALLKRKTGHLLRVLLLRVGAMSTGTGGARLRKRRAVQPVLVGVQAAALFGARHIEA